MRDKKKSKDLDAIAWGWRERLWIRRSVDLYVGDSKKTRDAVYTLHKVLSKKNQYQQYCTIQYV